MAGAVRHVAVHTRLDEKFCATMSHSRTPSGGFTESLLLEAAPRASKPGSDYDLLYDSDVQPHIRRPYILSGYRPLIDPHEKLWRTALFGLFSVHNETTLVWSHLIPFGWACHKMHWLLSLPDDAVSPFLPEHMRTTGYFFYAAAMFCFGTSVIAHLLGPILQYQPATALWRVDSYGICLMIAGSWLPGLAFGFRCRPGAGIAYSCITCVLLLLGAFGSATSETGRPGLAEKLRVGSLVLSTAFGLVPLAHFCTIAPGDEVQIFLPALLKMFLWYGFGFGFYASAIPESLQPGYWDLRGGSHLGWHICVFLAVQAYEVGVSTMLLHRDDSGCQGWPVWE